MPPHRKPVACPNKQISMGLYDEKNKLKSVYMPVRKSCQSCFEEFETTEKWRKRCPACKEVDAPYRKQIININQKVPF